MWSIDKLQEVWHLASRLHNGQKYGGLEEDEQVEYLNHIGSVTFEILNAIQQEEGMDTDLAIKCAILHDSIEDTQQTYADVERLFGTKVAAGVAALTKNESFDSKEKMMRDSLRRIKLQPKEVWAVKMADRICNLYAPPFYWTNERKIAYQKEAQLIYQELKTGNKYLAQRLAQKMEAYTQYMD